MRHDRRGLLVDRAADAADEPDRASAGDEFAGGGERDPLLGRRRPAQDFDATIASAVAWIYVAHIRLLTRRLATH